METEAGRGQEGRGNLQVGGCQRQLTLGSSPSAPFFQPFFLFSHPLWAVGERAAAGVPGFHSPWPRKCSRALVTALGYSEELMASA